VDNAQVLSVVMPCYNEEATVLESCKRVLASPLTRQLVVVDDASTDTTPERLAQLDDPRVQVVRQPVNGGKGAALRRGFAVAEGPIVVVQDADLEYDPADFEQLVAPLLDGSADVVFGSRFQSGRPHRVLYFWHSVGNKLLTLASNAMTNLNLTDMETCYKAFRKEVLDSFELEEDRFGIEPELTAKVARRRRDGRRWRIYEVPISYAGRDYSEGKKIRPRDGLRALYCIVRYAPANQRRRARRGTAPQ